MLFGGERGERDVGRDFFLPREDEQVLLRLAVDFAFPAFDRAVVDRERLVGDGEAVVDVDDAAEAAALRAGAERRVEGEERGRGGAEGAAGLGRVQAAGKMAELGEADRRRKMRPGPGRSGARSRRLRGSAIFARA